MDQPQQIGAIAEMRRRPLRIAFLCRPSSAGLWTPESTAAGMGGSEEAVVYMADLLARRGHLVSVHIRGLGQRRQFGSVIYDDITALRSEVLDVAVAWRHPRVTQLADPLGFRARRWYLWLHDIVSSRLLLDYQHSYHKIIVLSAYHRGQFTELPDDRFFLSANGIDLGQFDQADDNRDHRLMVYGSDYSRGLQTLLSAWPTIRKEVPGCRLNVFFGWDGIEHRDRREAESLHQELDALLVQQGVSHLGRIGHPAVAAQYMRAGVWAYPCSFEEASCISAMKAQAGGAVPAVIPTGALRETVRFGFRTQYGYDDIPAASSDRDLAGEWLQGLIHLLRSPAEQTRIRREMIPASKARFAWSTVVDQWEREFTGADHDLPHRRGPSHVDHPVGRQPAEAAISPDGAPPSEAAG
jgi:glycosyltransferase involved in cell wall biosynthesis